MGERICRNYVNILLMCEILMYICLNVDIGRLYVYIHTYINR